jgi:hypothetical protein
MTVGVALCFVVSVGLFIIAGTIVYQYFARKSIVEKKGAVLVHAINSTILSPTQLGVEGVRVEIFWGLFESRLVRGLSASLHYS